ncbi:MAG: aminopeptidase P N-terminal domain-containing protein [Cytophagaceae bacterium]
MKYLPIGKELFIKNRQKLVRELMPGSIAVFNSNDILPTNADGTMPFRQNNDLFYLSGIDQEETILLIFPDSKVNSFKEVLFIRETNEHIVTWEGHKLTKEEAAEVSGISQILWTSQFESTFKTLVAEAENIYLNSNEHSRAEKTIDTRDDRFVKWCKEKYPLHNLNRLAPIMQRLRMIKTEKEIELTKLAINITEKAFRRVLNFTKPGVWEYEIEAEIMYEFIRNRSRGPAYQSIIASGKNSCVLHYIDNNRQCKDGDIILLDFGAEYANYAADLTRVIPVNGRFTARQMEIYKSVLHVMKEAKKQLVPGNNFQNYNQFVGNLMEEELVKLKLLKREDINNQHPDRPLYKKYFMHGTSHFLGLDVHDVGDRHADFQVGMLFTCEPGIYVKEEGIGIRLENDILISENGPVDLMANIPVDPAEIEDLMKK